MRHQGIVLAIAASLLVILSGCISPGNQTPTPTPFTTIIEITPEASPSPVNVTPTPILGNVTPTPVNATPTPAASPTATPPCPEACRYGCIRGTTLCAQPQCPPECAYGCEPGTSACKQPVCPAECRHGCEPGTTTCRAAPQNLSMANPDFETGGYAGWNATRSAWGDMPKNGDQMNAQHSYYSIPYSGWQGTYFASTYPERTATGTLTSAQFTITRRYLEFLVVGQEDTQLCVGLKLDDETVYPDCDALKASNSTVRILYPSQPAVNQYSVFKRIVWDVGDYKGRLTSIEVIDKSVRGWIEVDDFRQTDLPSAPVTTVGPVSGYQCNNNGLCEPGLGEYEQSEFRCQNDCPPPSSCRYTSYMGGQVDYTVLCHSFRLMPSGLFLYLKNTGAGNNHSIILKGVKCTEETTPDPSTYVPMEKTLGVGEIAQISPGTMPCYDGKGVTVQRRVGSIFVGKIYFLYEDAETKYLYYGRLNFDAVVREDLQ